MRFVKQDSECIFKNDFLKNKFSDRNNIVRFSNLRKFKRKIILNRLRVETKKIGTITFSSSLFQDAPNLKHDDSYVSGELVRVISLCLH